MMDVHGWYIVGQIMGSVGKEGYRALKSWWTLDERMPEVDRAFNKVRNELFDVGLLADREYLDQIELTVALLPSLGEAGYVYEGTTVVSRLLGYKEGVIYLPSDLPRKAYVPGGTLTDTIRHEFGHAWHWLDPEFFERDWFTEAFGAQYNDGDYSPLMIWWEKFARNEKLQIELGRRRLESTRESFVRNQLLQDFVSEYAATLPCEDFAETFMVYLRHRNSLIRFQKRPGVYRKLRSVEKAVKTARKELGL